MESDFKFRAADVSTGTVANAAVRPPVSRVYDSLGSNGQLEAYVGAQEGARFLRAHPKTLMRLAREGRVPAYSFSDGCRRHWRFLLSELDKWMRARVNSRAHPVMSASPERRR